MSQTGSASTLPTGAIPRAGRRFWRGSKPRSRTHAKILNFSPSTVDTGHIAPDEPLDERKPDEPGPVLVVDDDPATRHLVALTLQEAGLEVIEAHDGARALDVLSHSRVSAVVLDNRMPGMSGIEVLARIRVNDPTVPVLLVTGDDEIADRVRGLESGATDYVVKPFSPDELLARVRAHLRGRAAWSYVVEEHLHERAVLAATLGSAATSLEPEEAAATICSEVQGLAGITGAAIVAFRGEGLAVPLAATGSTSWGLSPGRPLTVTLATYLRERAHLGPWVEPLDPDDAFSPYTQGPTLLACAPLFRDGTPSGLLLLGVAHRPGLPRDPDGSWALATAIDTAQIATFLIGRSLAGRDDQQGRAQIERVVADRSFTTVFQPIARLSDLEVVGFEALTRFDDGTPPGVRFAEADALGMGIELEVATLSRALGGALALPGIAWVSVNVSPSLVLAGGALRDVLLDEDRGRLIVLEITEHDRVDDYDELRRALEQLRNRFELSIDDAGSGFASLRHVLSLQPAFMKLDHSWVTGIDEDLSKQALIAGLAHFALRTGCRLIAEGIETEAELAVLRQLDADLGQGFLLGRPTSVNRPTADPGGAPG